MLGFMVAARGRVGLAALAALSAGLVATAGWAQNATWLANPGNSNFNNGANWSSGSVPVGVASFGTSTITSLSVGSTTNVGGLTFNAGAPSYTFAVPNAGTSLSLTGAGIVNNSVNAPTFNLGGGSLFFTGTATAGNAIINATGPNTSAVFQGSSTGGLAQVTLSGTNSALDFASHTPSPASVGSLAGSGALRLGSTQLSLGGNNQSTTYSGVITGIGSITKAGSGTWTLSGASTYSGGTTVSAGTLRLGATGSLLSTGALTVNGGTFDLNGNSQTVGNLSGTGGSITLNAGTLTANGTLDTILSATLSAGGTLIKQGNATLILTGNNSYGATTIQGGTLQIGNAVGGAGTLGTGGATVSAGATLAFNRSDTLTVNNQISGGGSLSQLGTGTVILTANNGYNGTTTIQGGTLQIGTGGTTGSLGTGAVIDNGSLLFRRSDTITVANAISGTGSLNKGIANSTLILTGNNTYSGTTTIQGGALQIGNGGTTGTLGTGAVIDNINLLFRRSDTIIVANDISGAGAVNKGSAGTVILTGNNTYSGTTTIQGGTLQVGNDGTAGTLGTGSVVDNTNLSFHRSDTLTVANDIGGTGNLFQGGSGTVILTGNNTYSGTTTVSAGTLQIGSGGTAGSLGTGAVVDNANLALNRSDTVTFATAVSGSGSFTQAGPGTLILTGDNSYTGTTTIAGGTLQLGNGGTTGALGGGGIVDNASLVFNRSDTITVSDAISGSGSLTQAGPGMLILRGANSYTGGTIVNAGILQAGAAGVLPSGGALTVNGGATFDLNGDGQTVGALSGSGAITLGPGVLSAGDDTGSTFSGVISGGGSLVKEGSGTLVLSGSNTFTGGTTIHTGILQIGLDNALATTGAVVVDTSGTFDLNSHNQTVGVLAGDGKVTLGAGTLTVGDANSVSFLGVLSGTGSVVKQGTGTLTLGGLNTFSGGLTIAGGTVAVSADANLGAAGGSVTFIGGTLEATASFTSSGRPTTIAAAGGTFNVDAGVTLGWTGNISGPGAVSKTGGGTLVLSGNNSFVGASVTGGTLQVAADTSLGDSAGGLTLDGGTLHSTASFTSSRSMTLGAGAGSVAVDSGTTLTWNGVIGGSGGLTATGPGTLVLGGANTYSGGTTVGAGTLQLGASNALLTTGALTVNGGTFDLNGNNQTVGALSGSGGTILLTGASVLTAGDASTTTFAGAIAGTGSLVKQGSGTLILTGAGSYTGGTTINAGTLQLGTSGSQATIAGTVTNNATLNVINADTSNVTQITNQGGATSFYGTSTAGSPFFGGLTIVNQGGGSLHFNDSSSAGSALVENFDGSAATHFNGNSSAGNAQIFASRAGSAIHFNDTSTAAAAFLGVAPSASLIFNDSSSAGTATIAVLGNAVFRNTASAGSAVILVGNGATLAFQDSASGGTGRLFAVAGGTIDFSALAGGTSVGSIEGQGSYLLGSNTVVVGLNDRSVVLDGVISGSGTLIKQGAGILTLTGANTLTGPIDVMSGGLLVNGSTAGSVVVSSGASLGGTGSIAQGVVNQGTIAIGGAIGTLGIGGSLVQTGSGTYQVKVNGTGQSDRLTVTGAATLAGTLAVQPQAGTYARTTTYTVLTASGGLSGTFGSTTSAIATLVPTVSYGAKSVTLSLLNTAATYNNPSFTGNQNAVANVLNQASAGATGDFAAVLNVISTLDPTTAAKVLDAITGTNYSGFSTAGVQSAQTFMNAFSRQAGGGQGGGQIALAEACDVACDATAARWGVWGGGLGAFGTIAGDSNSPGLTYSLGGFAAGIDRKFGESFQAGLATGFTATSLYTQNAPGYGTSNTLQFALYGEFTQGPVYLDSLAGYAHADNRMSRPIIVPGLPYRVAQGYTTANQLFGLLEGGYRLDVLRRIGGFVTPFARLQGSTSTQDGFSESGADSLNLTVAQQTTQSLRTVLGAQLGAAIDAPWHEKLNLTLRAGWSHEFADLNRPVTSAFAGAPALTFTTQGAIAPRDGAVLGLGGNTAIAERTTVYLRYDGDFAGGNTNHVLSAGVRYVW
jgi:autotransporter-associated beta strand protein